MKELDIIQSKIFEIRGQKVMLDFDLAELYGVQTKVFNQTVKRNFRRFPSDFMFRLTDVEFQTLRSQSVTSNIRGGRRYNPYAFSEGGVAMLSGILNSDVAIEVNINIMRIFVSLHQMINNLPNDRIDMLEEKMRALKCYIEDAFTDYNDINEDTRVQLELINESLAQLQADKLLIDKNRNPIGFIKGNDK